MNTILRRLILSLLLLPLLLSGSGGLFAAEDPFTIGVFPRRNAALTQTMFQPLATHLQQALGRPVVIETAKDYASFWSAIEQGRYQLLHYNQYHYVRCHHLFGHRVIATNVEFGRDTIAGALYVRSDSPLLEVTDLKGKTIVFGGAPDAFIAYISLVELLRGHGLEARDYKQEFAVNPPNAVLAPFFHRADAGGAGDIGILIPTVRQLIDPQQLRTLATTQRFPHLPWAVTKTVSDADEAIIRTTLLSLEQSGEGRGILASMRINGLRTANDTLFAPVRESVFKVLGERY